MSRVRRLRGRSLSREIDEVADQLAFAAEQLGLDLGVKTPAAVTG